MNVCIYLHTTALTAAIFHNFYPLMVMYCCRCFVIKLELSTYANCRVSLHDPFVKLKVSCRAVNVREWHAENCYTAH